MAKQEKNIFSDALRNAQVNSARNAYHTALNKAKMHTIGDGSYHDRALEADVRRTEMEYLEAMRKSSASSYSTRRNTARTSYHRALSSEVMHGSGEDSAQDRWLEAQSDMAEMAYLEAMMREASAPQPRPQRPVYQKPAETKPAKRRKAAEPEEELFCEDDLNQDEMDFLDSVMQDALENGF